MLWLFQIKSKKLTADANMPQVLTLEQYSKDEVESGDFLFLFSQQCVILSTENQEGKRAKKVRYVVR